jgi:hypothetical protein
MLYTIKDVKDRIDELDSEEYVSVSIDGIPRGIAIVSDLKEQLYGYGDRANKRRIKQMFLSGVTFDVKRGINLYPVPKEDFWRELGGENLGELKNTPIIDIADKRPCDIFGRSHDGMVCIDSNNQESEAETEPLVKWDADKEVIHFRDDGDVAKNKSPNKKPLKQGLFEKFKGWLKGDKGYKR